MNEPLTDGVIGGPMHAGHLPQPTMIKCDKCGVSYMVRLDVVKWRSDHELGGYCGVIKDLNMKYLQAVEDNRRELAMRLLIQMVGPFTINGPKGDSVNLVERAVELSDMFLQELEGNL